MTRYECPRCGSEIDADGPRNLFCIHGNTPIEMDRVPDETE